MCAGVTLIPFVPETYFFSLGLLVLSLLAIGNGLVPPLNTSLISMYAKSEEQGEMLGISQSVGALGRILGPLSGSLLYGLDSHVPYLAGGVCLLISITLALPLLAFEISAPSAAPKPQAR
jgi:MFS family permease